MLHLLCCALWEREPDVHLFDASGTDWQGILDIARRHTVHGLVASRMKAVARELEAEDVLEQCWLTMLEVGRANSQLDSVLADVVKALGVAGERAVLMKGQGVARYYAESLSARLRRHRPLHWFAHLRGEPTADGTGGGRGVHRRGQHHQAP